jgi:hypothetical protein
VGRYNGVMGELALFQQIAVNFKDYAMKALNVNDLNEGGLVFILSTPPVVYPTRYKFGH